MEQLDQTGWLDGFAIFDGAARKPAMLGAPITLWASFGKNLQNHVFESVGVRSKWFETALGNDETIADLCTK